MPRRMTKGGESRLSLEGLRGFHAGGGRVVESIYAHGEKRRQRTVFFEDGGSEEIGIPILLDALIGGQQFIYDDGEPRRRRRRR